MEDLLHALLDLLSLGRLKRGPLLVRAQAHGAHLELTLENQGRRKLQFAALQAHDKEGRRHFPETSLPSLTTIPPGETLKATLPIEVLRAMRCQQLKVLDCSGNAWEVEGAVAY